MMRGMSNRDAAGRGLFGGTVMDEAKETRESESRAVRRAPDTVRFVRFAVNPPAVVPAEETYASFLPPPVWKNPTRVEAGQIWDLGWYGVRGGRFTITSVDVDSASALMREETVPGGKYLADLAAFGRGRSHCVGFQLPSGGRVIVGEVRTAFMYLSLHLCAVRPNARIAVRALDDGTPGFVMQASYLDTFPLDVEATRRACADRIDRDGVPALTLRPGGTHPGQARVISVDLATPGGDFTAASVWREDPNGHRRVEEVYRQPGAMVARGLTPTSSTTPGEIRAPGPSWTGLSAGPHVEAEPPPRDHDSEARGLCLGIPWMSGETDRNYAARLDVEEARQVAQKISPLLARPIPFRASLAIPFEASSLSAPTVHEIRSLMDALYHLEAELSRGMRNERAIDEALAGFCQRTRRTGPGWLRPSLEKYVAERERGQR